MVAMPGPAIGPGAAAPARRRGRGRVRAVDALFEAAGLGPAGVSGGNRQGTQLQGGTGRSARDATGAPAQRLTANRLVRYELAGADFAVVVATPAPASAAPVRRADRPLANRDDSPTEPHKEAGSTWGFLRRVLATTCAPGAPGERGEEERLSRCLHGEKR